MDVKEKESLKFSDYVKKFSNRCLFEKLLVGFSISIIVLFVLTFVFLYKGEQGSLTKVSLFFMSFIYFIYKLLVFLSIIDLGFILYNRFFLSKNTDKMFVTAYILSAIGIIVVFLQNFSLSVYVKFIKSLYGRSFMNIFSSGFGVLKFTKEKIQFMFLLYILAFILLIISIVFFFMFITKTKEVSDKENSNSLNIKKEDIDKVIDKSMAFVSDGANLVKDAINSKEVKDTINVGKKAVNKNKKKIIIGLVAILVVICAFFTVKTVKYALKPDAYVSMKNIKLKITVTGKNGFGKAIVNVDGVPKITNIKDNKKTSLIYAALDNNYDVKLDKETGLKNGDKVTATLTLRKNDKNLKLKIDAYEIKETITVENLEEIINSIKDLDKNVRERMDKKAKADIVKSMYRDIKNVKLEKVKTFEKKVSEQDLSNMVNAERFTIREIYKVNYDKEKLAFGKEEKEYEPVEKIYIYEFSNFKKKNNAVDFYVHLKDSFKNKDETILEDLENKYKIEGFNEEK